ACSRAPAAPWISPAAGQRQRQRMPPPTLRLRPEVSRIGCAVLTRLAEILRPIDHLAATPVDRECDAHLAESRSHDVGAVMRTREPARDRLLRRPDAACDILAHHAPAIAGARHALSGSAAIASRMTEEVVRSHVLGMGAGCLRESGCER